MNKVKEEKGFLHKEVMQVTPSGYWPGSLEIERCLCSCMTQSGYCLGLLTAEKHQRWNLNFGCHIACVPIYPSSPIKTIVLTWLGMCVDQLRAWKVLHLLIKLVWKPRWPKNLTILPKELDFLFMKQGPFRELKFYQYVTKCCSGYNHPPKFFLSFILEPPYQPSLAVCLALSKYICFTWVLMAYQPVLVNLFASHSQADILELSHFLVVMLI